MAAPIRVALDEVRFRRLVAGQVVATAAAGGERVEIILSDIGWQRILRAIVDAMAGGPPTKSLPLAGTGGPPDPPQASEFLPWSPKQRGRR